MARLPKSIIKKYGISKKAWSVFRGSKGSSKKKTKSRGYSMAKKRRFGGKKNGKGFLGKALNILVGAGVAALYEVFISPRIPLARNIKNIIEMVVGIIVMAMPRLPMMVRAGGAALATINAFEILVPLISNVSSGSSSSSMMNV
jgi:hypothetical protein